MLHTTQDWNEVQATLDQRGEVVVYLTASWCQPCRVIKPQFGRASVIDADRDYYIVDIDEVPFVVEHFNIQSVPTIVYLKEGQPDSRIGARTAQEIVAEVSQL